MTYDELADYCKEASKTISEIDCKNRMLDKENQELKEKLDKYENPEDMTLMMMWCTEKVKDENKKLKRQIEDANEKILLLQASEPMLNYKKALEETQQKEFINYLEDLIKHKRLNATCMFEYNNTVLPLKEILQKYKETIGVLDEDNKQ